MASLNAAELARRQFREIAPVAGLIFQGYPGSHKSVKQVQASPLAFALLVDRAREQVSSEKFLDRVRRLAAPLERAADNGNGRIRFGRGRGRGFR